MKSPPYILRPTSCILPTQTAKKDFLKSKQFPCVQFLNTQPPRKFEKAVETIGFPSVIKTAAFGYDGKGQIKLDSADSINNPQSHRKSLNHPDRVVVEEWIEHKANIRLSVLEMRKEKKQLPVSENVHIHHILHSYRTSTHFKHCSTRPSLAEQLADTLEVVGLLMAVNFFLTQDDQLIVNEMAPRPHNSGTLYRLMPVIPHNFNNIRAITGLPMEKTDTHTPAVMIIILSDLWSETLRIGTFCLKTQARNSIFTTK